MISGRQSFLVHASLVLALAGCAAGPDFERPAPPAVQSYTGTELPAQTEATAGPAGAAQRFAAGQEIPAQWWALFRSEPSTA